MVVVGIAGDAGHHQNFYFKNKVNFPAITITDATPFTLFMPDKHYRKKHRRVVEVYTSGAVLYYGEPPKESVSYDIDNSTSIVGRSIVPTDILLDGDANPVASHRLVQGMTFTCPDDNTDDGKYIIAVAERFVTMNAAFEMATGLNLITVEFSYPEITSATGMPIPVNTSKTFVADPGNNFLDTGIKFVVATGQTATVRIIYN